MRDLHRCYQFCHDDLFSAPELRTESLFVPLASALLVARLVACFVALLAILHIVESLLELLDLQVQGRVSLFITPTLSLSTYLP